MAGALTERAFVESLDRAGFTGVAVLEREPYGVEDLALEPTFDDALVALMRRVLPARLQRRVGVRLLVRAVRPDQPAR